MAPRQKPVVAGVGQTRLDGFLSKFARENEKSASSTSKPPSREGKVDNAAFQSSISRPLLLSPKRQTSKTPFPPKRPLDDDDNDYSDDGIEPIPVRPSKSPRTTPQPEPKADHRGEGRTNSSSLSSLRSPSPPTATSVKPSIEHQATSTSSFRPRSTVSRTVRPQTLGSRPHTAESSKSTMTGTFGSVRTSVPPSSQRVVKDGREMVLNSDSDGSDDSLADLDDVLGISKTTVKSSSPLTELSPTPTPPVGYFIPPSSVTNSMHSASQPRSKLRQSMTALVEGARRQAESNARIKQTLAAIEELDKADSPSESGMKDDKQLQSLLKNTAREDDDAERLMDAINRTETLNVEKTWPFFDYDQYRKRAHEVKLIRLSCGDHPASAFLHDEEDLKSMLVSGTFKHLIRAAPLSKGLVQWLFQRALHDGRSDVRAACVQALFCDTTLPADDMNNLVRTELQKMGMRDEATGYQHKPAAPEKPVTANAPSNASIDWTKIRQLLSIIPTFANRMSPGVAVENAVSLVRMGIDNRIVDDARNVALLSVALKSCLEVLFQNGPEDNCLQLALDTIFGQTADDDLRLRVLSVMPQSNVRVSSIRRKIAVAWFYEDQSMSHQEPRPFTEDGNALGPPLFDMEKVLGSIQKRKKIFKINRNTDWVCLKPKLDLLTIAIGTGDGPLNVKSPEKNELSANDKTAAVATVKMYDAVVDDLIHIISTMDSLVVDKGTSHVSRTEAKDLLRRIKSMLTYIVRTKPPQRKGIFDAVDHDIKQFMEPRVDGPSNAIQAVGDDGRRVGGSAVNVQTSVAVDTVMDIDTGEDERYKTPIDTAPISPPERHGTVAISEDAHMRSETDQDEFHTAAESSPA